MQTTTADTTATEQPPPTGESDIVATALCEANDCDCELADTIIMVGDDCAWRRRYIPGEAR